MPTYEYACKKCGETFDIVQSFTDEPLKRHKGGCGGSVRKVFGSVGISFKGSGFYKNDSRSTSSSASETKAEKTESKSESSSGAKQSETSKTESPKTETKKTEAKKSEKKDSSSTKASS